MLVLRLAAGPAEDTAGEDHRSTATGTIGLPCHWALSRLSLRAMCSASTISFRFQPSSFVPANTKARLVLKLSSPATARDTPSLHQTYAGTADLTSRLTQVFFQPGAVADAERTRLLNQAHFVLFNDQLKSIRLPSAAVHVAAQELSLDWRQLCHTFMRDEFKCRFGSSASVAWWRKFP